METSSAVRSDAVSLAAAELSGDGLADLATANRRTNGVSLLLGTAEGGFSVETRSAVGIDPVSLATADFNGAGLSDLATANRRTNDVSLLLGTAEGGSTAETRSALGIDPVSLEIGRAHVCTPVTRGPRMPASA